MLMHPGQTGPLVDLQAFVRDMHERTRAAIIARNKAREPYGAGPDEHIDPAKVREITEAIAKASGRSGQMTDDDYAALRRYATALAQAVASPLVDPGEYVPDEQLDGIRVQFKAAPAGYLRRLRAKLDEQNDRTAKLTDPLAAIESDEEAMGTVGEIVKATLHRAVYETPAGVEDRECDDQLVHALRFSGLLNIVARAGQVFQDIPVGKAVRFGSSPPSTSQSGSTATSADQARNDRSAAAAGHGSLTGAGSCSPEPSTKPTPAPDDTSSTTLILSPPSSFPVPSVNGSDSTGWSG